MKAGLLKFGMNIWPPFRASGIKVLELAGDYSYAKVRASLHFYNRNYVKTHFGGTLFTMTDPFYMIMLLNRLGSRYQVWDQSSSIQFIKPGRGKVFAEFRVDDTLLEEVAAHCRGGEKMLLERSTDVVNEAGEPVARVSKTIYIRLKKRFRQSTSTVE